MNLARTYPDPAWIHTHGWSESALEKSLSLLKLPVPVRPDTMFSARWQRLFHKYRGLSAFQNGKRPAAIGLPAS
jgi:hypothetical protein